MEEQPKKVNCNQCSNSGCKMKMVELLKQWHRNPEGTVFFECRLGKRTTEFLISRVIATY